MPMNFELLTQGGAGGLPDFVSGIQKQQQEEEARRQQAALAMMQIQAQQQASMPDELDYRKDARAAAYDEVKLAREKQAMELDLNTDSRAERKLTSDIGLTEKQKEEIDNNIKLNWEKFAVSKDIDYQKLDMAKDMQSFTKDQMKTDLGYKIKWGDNQDEREERKFGFEIQKYREKQKMEDQFKETLARARQQGSEAVTNTLIDNGMFDQAKTFTEMNKVISEQNDAKLSKYEQKQKDAMFVTLAPTILKGGELTAKQAQQVSDVIYGQEFTDSLVGSGQLQQVAKTAFLHVYSKDLESLSGDPMQAAKLAAAANGYKVSLPKTPADVQELNKFIGGKFEQAEVARENKKVFIEAIEAADAAKLAGIFSRDFQGMVGDVADAAALVGRAAGIEIKSAKDFGRAEEILSARLLDLQKRMGNVTDKDGNSVINARTSKLFEDVRDFGGDGLKSLMEAQNYDAKINDANRLQKLIDENPDSDVNDLRVKLFNAGNEDYQSRPESSNPKDQTAAYKRYLELKAKAGR